MEAIIVRTPNHQLELAVSEWLRATRRLVRAALRATGDALVNYSRAGLMLKGGSRRLRRL
jgi:hypothetical protein